MAASTTLTPEQRVLRSRMAAHALHSQGKTNTTAATSGFMARFERQVDPDGTLAPDERTKRARSALQSYMTGLSLKRSKAAGKRKETS